MEKIEIKKIEVPYFTVCYLNGMPVWDDYVVNEYELNEIRLQIIEKKIEGCYIWCDKKKIKLGIDGQIHGDCPELNFRTNQLMKIAIAACGD